jgi:ATP-binding protein involved in chromosome partitioning
MMVKAQVSPGLRVNTRPQVEQCSSWVQPENSRPSPQCGQRLRSPRDSAVPINFERDVVIDDCGDYRVWSAAATHHSRGRLRAGTGVGYALNVKRYHDIAGDGGSRILEQVAEQRSRITDGLAGVRHLVAVGSGKGGVGKSTLTLHLAGALRARGLRIAILDADFNGPSQARMAGVQGAVFVPGQKKMALPRTSNGISVFSMGSVIPESEALEFESAAEGESHTWRATREFALLGEILGSCEWGPLDLLMFDLPPGAERTVQYADFLGPFDSAQGKPRTSFLLVTIPSEVSRGVVARSVAALSKGPNRVLGYVENMSGYYCRDCNAIKPLFDSPKPFDSAHPSTPLGMTLSLSKGQGKQAGLEIPCLGSVPFDPELARHCDRGIPFAAMLDTPVGRALDHVAQQLLDRLQPPLTQSRELRLDRLSEEPPK